MHSLKLALTRRVLFIALFIFTASAHALKFNLPSEGNDLVGHLQTVISQPGDTLSRLGMAYDMGYYEMLEANPDLPPRAQLQPGTEVLIPAFFILPRTRHGIVINLAELRAYYFPEDAPVVYTFPIGAGREGWNTPRAITKVVNKKKDPVWIKPDSILAEDAALGKPYKKYYASGAKDNPLGKYAIYFALPGIRMHGTNYPATVGQRASHGCMRMLPGDIELLYQQVPIGTRVVINHNQFKAGWLNHVLYLQSEIPFTEYADGQSIHEAIAEATKQPPAIIDQKRLQAVVEDQMGIPIAIGHDSTMRQLPADTDFDLDDSVSSYDESAAQALG